MGTARQTPPSSELKTFSSRMSKAIAFQKMDIPEVAKKLGVAPADIKKMLTGMREPSMKKLIILAKTLDCSVDYLLGLTSEMKHVCVVASADTNAISHKSVERGQTSGQKTGKIDMFISMIPELLEADVDLLAYLAGFLISREKKNMENFVKQAVKKPDKIDLVDDDFDDFDDLADDVNDWEDDEFDDDGLDDDDDFDDDDLYS